LSYISPHGIELQDFDGGVVGQTVVNGLTATSSPSEVKWQVVNASDFPGGTIQLSNAVVEQKTWVAVASCDIVLTPFFVNNISF
jgi:hypothetical protein